MADISRDQFDEDSLVVKKIFQQGKYLLDDEVNVIQDNASYYLKRLLSYMVEGVNTRFGNGFKVEDHADVNKVTVLAGGCAVHLTDTKSTKRCDLIWSASNIVVSGFTTPSGSNRTDYVYLDIYEDEIDATEDANLVNPARGEETTRDLRLVWSIQKSQGSAPGTPTAGHTYVTIATIARYNGVAQIQPVDITNVLVNCFAYPRRELLFAASHVAAHDTAGAVPATDFQWRETTISTWLRHYEANVRKVTNMDSVNMRLYVDFVGDSGSKAKCRLAVDTTYDESQDIANADDIWIDLEVSLVSVAVGDYFTVGFDMYIYNLNSPNYFLVQKPNIWIEYA